MFEFETERVFFPASFTCLTVLSALFRQNHQRPDFLCIFSFTQASSVALGGEKQG